MAIVNLVSAMRPENALATPTMSCRTVFVARCARIAKTASVKLPANAFATPAISGRLSAKPVSLSAIQSVFMEDVCCPILASAMKAIG